MKKIFLSLTMLLFTIAAFSQQQFKPVKIDSLVTISMPVGYQLKDTLGQHIYGANGMLGYMTVIVAPNEKNNAPLKKEKDLNKVLKDYITHIQGQSSGGSALHVRDTTVGTLKAKAFTLKSDDGTGTFQFINFVLIYTQDNTYTFEYVYPSERQELVKDEYKAFISSIKLSPELQRNDQYLSPDTGMSSTAKIEIYGSVTLVIAFVIVLLVRKKNNLIVG
ncbi:hypothetical protein JN11_01553 [Mucilaginibacter frigoritolerans]|jgi:hypothetical protein|uniref:LPXTG-motif cell wall-anchored protein n=1 Tax=Mucilaginibacter frigoritolerans TaxID=652788 RepID=A0A562U9R0_9SPHI|nr:hypothetical protein [Mucilaginibacter frigoritolerans]TWJ02580.1 hypothetical protein JN11_01553 [Mucilaginibacter frigoritolerans]